MATTTVDAAETEPAPPTLRPFALVPVVAVTAVSAVLLLFSASRYGYFGDELYFLAAGRRLSFGYADQGPVLPLLAWLMDSLWSGSLVVLRLPAVVLTLAAVVISALIARELGGGRGAQLLTAVAYASSPFLLLQGDNLSTNAVDCALWVVITWLVVRWVRTRQDRLLLFAALVTAVDMQVKWLIPAFWVVLAVCALIFGPRDLVRRPLLWLGGLIVVLVSVPSLLWQADHGWPQLALAEAVADEQVYSGGAIGFLPLAIVIAGVLGAPLLCFGVWVLMRRPALRPYRFLGATMLVLAVLFMFTGGRIYYLGGMYAVMFGAAAVILAQHWKQAASRRRRRVLTGTGVLVSVVSVAVVVWSLPWQSAQDIPVPAGQDEAALQISLYGEFGWPELTAAVVAAHRSLSPSEQRNSAVITDTYWQAGALDQLARDELPPIYSPARGFGYFAVPPDSATTFVCVGGEQTQLRTQFAVLEPIGRVDTRLGFPGDSRDVTLWKCAQPKASWSQVWPEWMRL